MPAFLERYPAVTPDWFFDNHPVELIAGGFDAAIGGGFDLPPGMVARELGRIHLIAVASPAFLHGKRRPNDPTELAEFAGVAMRSPLNGRVRTLVMRNSAGTEMAAVQRPVMMVNDPDALSRATLLGLGVGLVAVPHAAPHLGERRAGAAAAGLVWRRWADFAVFLQPETAAGQDARFCRFRHRGVPCAEAGASPVCQEPSKQRRGLTRVRGRRLGAVSPVAPLVGLA